ncbi:MAG: DUF106 domain-containing protein [Candidatus Aenigmarchaeota archaeon]|nr:DUF106 domain-containing protein [Candidatus Aenigmarchaeota archaeon]
MTAVTEMLLISLGLSFLLAVLYRVLTKPVEMRQIKEEMKQHRQRMKELQKAGNKAEADKALAASFQLNQKQMRMTMKPMMVSLLIFIFALSWLGTVYGPAVGVHTEETTIPALGSGWKGTFSPLNASDTAVEAFVYDNNQTVRLDVNGNGDFLDDPAFPAGEVLYQTEGQYWKFAGKDQGRWPFAAPQPAVFIFTPDIIALPFPLPLPAWDYVGIPFVVLEDHLSWFWWYVLITLPATFVFRKLLGVE